jgi:ABC-type nitrate/sulfonate/bicarbonate transport system permease component
MTVVLASHGRKGWLAYIGTPTFVAVWSALSYGRVIDPLLLPPPDRVLLAVFDIGPALAGHFGATVARIAAGFAFSLLGGCALGIWMQKSRMLYGILDGLIETWRPVPPVALVPFFILAFGFSEFGRLLLVVLGTMLIVVVTMIEALDRVPPALIQFGLVSGLSKRRLFQTILIPAAVPNAKAGLRVALAACITIVIASEFLGARYGLGYLISVAKVTLTTPTIFLCVILLGLVGFTLDAALRTAISGLTRWEHSSREALR